MSLLSDPGGTGIQGSLITAIGAAVVTGVFQKLLFLPSRQTGHQCLAHEQAPAACILHHIDAWLSGHAPGVGAAWRSAGGGRLPAVEPCRRCLEIFGTCTGAGLSQPVVRSLTHTRDFQRSPTLCAVGGMLSVLCCACHPGHCLMPANAHADGIQQELCSGGSIFARACCSVWEIHSG